MARLVLSICVMMIVVSGCQQAKMRAVPPKQQPKAATPGVYAPPTYPTPEQPPITTPQPQPPVTEVIPPRNPVVEPTDENVVVNPPQQPPITPIFVPPPTITTEVVEIKEEVCGEGGACPEIEPINGSCEPVPFTGVATARQLDVLFVVDTSASLTGKSSRTGAQFAQGEVAQIGKDLKNFLIQLDDNIEPNVAVILGHGPRSQWHGKLFKSSAGEKTVLKYEDFKRFGNKEQIAAKMADALKLKLDNVEPERGGAQGEALLYSLFSAVDDDARLENVMNEGMFRPDAALTVFMVSDEQDVCFKYPADGSITPVLKEKVNGVMVPDPIETAFFNDYCMKANHGKLLEPKAVYDVLLTLKQGKNLNLYAIAYTDPNLQNDPEFKANPDREDENERAYGILDFVALHTGHKIVDLKNIVRAQDGSASFAKELEYLGQDTQMQMAYANPIRCTTINIHPDSIDLSTIKVSVINDRGTSLGSFSGACGPNKAACDDSVKGWAQGVPKNELGHRFLEVLLDDGALKHVFTSNTLTGGAFNVEFKTKRGIDPRTGQPGYAAD